MTKFLLSLIVSSVLFMQPVKACAQFGGNAGIGGKAGTGGGPTSSGTASYVQGAVGSYDTTSSTGTVALTGVTAGDLIVGCLSWNLGGTPSISISDGTTTATLLPEATDGTFHDYSLMWYILSANSGNRTYTVTTSIAVNSADYWVSQFHSSGPGSWHSDSGSGSGASSSTASNSGNFTTTYSANNATVNCTQIYNVAATTSSPSIGGNTPVEFPFSPTNTFDHQYYLLNTGITAGAASLTYSPATDWTNNAYSFANH
jgi:hypothetical protein